MLRYQLSVIVLASVGVSACSTTVEPSSTRWSISSSRVRSPPAPRPDRGPESEVEAPLADSAQPDEFGDLQIVAPPDVKLQLDGEAIERPDSGRGILISDLKAGPHQVEASLRGYRTTVFSVLIRPHEQSLLEIELADVASTFGLGQQQLGLMLRQMSTIHFLASPAEPAVGVYVDGQRVEQTVVRVRAFTPALAASEVPDVLEACQNRTPKASVGGDEACLLPPRRDCADRFFVPRTGVTVCVRTEVVRRVPLQATVPVGRHHIRFTDAQGRSIETTMSLSERNAYLRVDFDAMEIQDLTRDVTTVEAEPATDEVQASPTRRTPRRPIRKPVSSASPSQRGSD